MGGRARMLIVTALMLPPLAGCGPASSGSVATSTAPASVARASPPLPIDSTRGEPATTSAAPGPTVSAPTIPAPTILAPTVPVPTLPAPAVRSGADASLDAGVGEPLAISIPAIGVESMLLTTGTLVDGTIDVPKDPSVAAWFTGAPRPGDRGPAVIVGHVDSKHGPGVFWRLHELPVGAIVTIETTTGPIEFVAERIEQYAKDGFPTADVYGAVPRPALRLITCGGSFNRSIGHYRDNIVAYLVAAAR
jgi:sortase family protein